MVGSIGGVIFQLTAGRVVHVTQSYTPLFAVACSSYLLALLLIQTLSPRLERAQVERA
jgi:ACS family hexuronate transporter-like MFS transporter